MKELQATQKSRLQVNVYKPKTEEDADTNTLVSMASVDGNRKKSPKKAGNAQHPEWKGGAGA